jgi:hypothetical protein
MEGFSGNENALFQNEGCAMFLSQVKYENEVMKKTQENHKVWKLKKVEFPKNMKKLNNLKLLQISSKEDLKSS